MSNQKLKKIINIFKKNIFIISVLIVVIIIHFFFGLYHLGKAAYIDERLWTYSGEKRIEKYWINILEGDWKHTRPSDKPGISLAFLSGPSLLLVTPSSFKDAIPDKQSFMHMLFIMRFPLLFFGTIILIFLYFVLTVLFNKQVSILSTTFIGLSPLLLGISRIINPDALSWIIIPLTIFTYFTYQKTKEKKWLFLTGILLGWGLLTKYIANLLFLFFIFLIFSKNLFYLEITKEKIKRNIRQSLKALVVIVVLSLGVFYIFYPGTWVKPDRLLIGTIWSQPFKPIWQYFLGFIALLVFDYFFLKSNLTTWFGNILYKLRIILLNIAPLVFLVAIVLVLYAVYFNQKFIDFETIITSPKTSINAGGIMNNFKAFIVSFYVLIFGINPLAFLGVLFAIFTSFWQKTKQQLNNFSIIWNLFAFIIIFYVASIFNTTIPIVRYQIILYPLIFVIAGYGWYQLGKLILQNKFNMFFNILVTLIVITSALTLYLIRPHYFSYNSPLLPRQYLINIKDMGDGSYEAAQFINNLPNAKNLKIWTDKRGVCKLFIGKVCSGGLKKKDFLKHGPRYDYFVISKGRERHSIKISEGYAINKPHYPIHMRKLYESSKAIFEIHPGNRSANYVKIIPEKQVHVWQK